MAAGNTYEAIATQTLGSDTATVTFSSISGSYTDLVLVCVANSTVTGSGSNSYRVRLNGDTGANYSNTTLIGNGSTAASTRDSSETYVYLGILPQTSADKQISTLQFMSYSNTTTYKTALARGNHAGSQVQAGVGLWRSTSAVTSIELSIPGSNLTASSTFSLYGIKNA